MVEFTGERVIPDQVEPDLWSEHMARYAFARRYADGKRVLDCGCGAGYGTGELAQVARQVTGLDLSCDAIDYARANYARRNADYIAASCLYLPFSDASFELVVALEVIEHLADYRRFLEESKRVLAPSGLFIVSTPNKRYYAESRARSGPNPFHEHEFEAEEFHSELTRVYPCVTLLAQNRVECFAFAAVSRLTAEARVDGDDSLLADANFLVALCSKSALPQSQPFIYVPRAANLLREREQHIRLLEDELRTKQEWLRQMQQDRDDLLQKHRELQDAYETQNRWAKTLDADLTSARERIERLQREFAAEQQSALETAKGYDAKIEELEAENQAKTQWALDTDARLTAEIDRITKDLVRSNELLQTAENTVVERTTLAQKLEAERQALEALLNAVRSSRWLKLGRKMGVGPILD